MKPLKHQENRRAGDEQGDAVMPAVHSTVNALSSHGQDSTLHTPLLDEMCNIEYGTRVVHKRDGGNRYPVYGGGGATFEMDVFNREDRLVVGRFAMSKECTRFVKGKFFLNDSGLTVSPKSENLLQRYLDYQMFALNDDIYALGRGTAQKNLDVPMFRNLKIYLPPLAEQQRIVAILDEAFEGIATARKHAEQNLQNAKALFESHLQTIFTQSGPTGKEHVTSQTLLTDRNPAVADDAEMARLHAGYVTRTGGRVATTRLIPGPLSLAVGMPSTGARKGWRWTTLTDLARLESGHTPSRNHPEYWGGAIPWLGIQDARKHHGDRIDETSQTITELGTANSSARLLPANTVCLSRTASVGYVVVMGRPMATSQDFVNWVCSASLIPDFLKYIFLAERRDGLLRYASGSVHQTIYFPEAKAFYICHPDINEQLQIINQCDALRDETNRLCDIYTQKIAALDALKKSLLRQAFSGEL